ncbi:TIGR03668 family PPOX class F420-dependent oxidoreductase [Rhodococcoides fascians A25f]|uniref:TIGR03668 family PPOX class F420-dependent oxidoreductase n=1 Tax=Rhodococcoides fascians TaxID=1828 RepID=UPI00055FF7CA|nr:TIGR03668 family PPOX class F420-dependent oxidoreductase [Rhodococcus fascians]QII04129.1 TIGR03668 family PPOX class F420-dependent oxidoreductase [Rhodococcus fascians A25f]
MKIDNEVQRFTDAPRAQLSTINPDGTPHLVPIVFAVTDTGDRIVTAIDWKPKTTQKLQRLDNIRADSAVSLIVDHYTDDWSQLWWIRADGNAHIAESSSTDGTAAIDALVAKYSQYKNNRPEGPVIIIEKLSWRSWSAS